ncbi:MULTISPECIES: hypothetical protein [Bacillus cereus group]|uniref:Hook-associated protein 2 n=2 Tax=Bacillus cereus group TaxID=86661 RepID=A0A2C1DZ34_BACCE|nr:MULTISPECIES: hypothetical protein [Bacillus cereus group]OFD82446.1 hypothetical protein BWGOE8_10310 [Bacillus mycoides]OFD82830.1 hypothetical protein BWGOE9_09980 [Bacillus mycoides]OFD85261.1 hypothetical protein BWGOE10_10130 [Bacillus mycoides]PGT05622.1 hypothetical protein COD09_05200 [Bacillus cereus]
MKKSKFINLTTAATLSLSLLFTGAVSAATEENFSPKQISLDEVTSEKIDMYQLNQIQDTFTKNTENQVTFYWKNTQGIEESIDLSVRTDARGNITSVSEVTTHDNLVDSLVKKKKPGKPGKGSSPKVPYKLNGGTNKSSFINEHAYNRHKYNPKEKSTSSKTQYGRDVDVKKLREETMHNYENKWSQTDNKGNRTTTYAKQFDGNVSTSDSSTSHHRVIINHSDSSRSTQFPLYLKN